MLSPVVGSETSKTLHQIKLPNYSPQMPEGTNRKLFFNTCTSCHSARYVMMQPEYSWAVWTAELNKMRNAYGAPLEDSQIEPLLDYLMHVRGAKS